MEHVFEFTNYDVPVTIAGREVSMNCSTDTGDYLKKVSVELRQLAEEFGKGEKSHDDVVSYGMGVIDNLLGEGSAKQLLEGRKNKISDTIDLCLFLTEVAAEFRNEHKKTTANRAQRRAVAKKK